MLACLFYIEHSPYPAFCKTMHARAKCSTGHLLFTISFKMVLKTDILSLQIKTTAPLRYKVRPNLALIDPKSVAKVHVLLVPREFHVLCLLCASQLLASPLSLS